MLDHTREQYDLAASIGDVLHEMAMIAGTCFIVGVVFAWAAVTGGIQ
jgi:hypothetical protein